MDAVTKNRRQVAENQAARYKPHPGQKVMGGGQPIPGQKISPDRSPVKELAPKIVTPTRKEVCDCGNRTDLERLPSTGTDDGMDQFLDEDDHHEAQRPATLNIKNSNNSDE